MLKFQHFDSYINHWKRPDAGKKWRRIAAAEMRWLDKHADSTDMSKLPRDFTPPFAWDVPWARAGGAALWGRDRAGHRSDLVKRFGAWHAGTCGCSRWLSSDNSQAVPKILLVTGFITMVSDPYSSNPSYHPTLQRLQIKNVDQTLNGRDLFQCWVLLTA